MAEALKKATLILAAQDAYKSHDRHDSMGWGGGCSVCSHDQGVAEEVIEAVWPMLQEALNKADTK